MGSMGSSTSRPSRRPRQDRRKRSFLSSLICGGSASHAPTEIEDYPSELLVDSMKHSQEVVAELGSQTKESSSACEAETGASSESCAVASEESSLEDCSTNFVRNNLGKPLCKSKQLVPPHQLSVDHRINDTASTSYDDQPFSDAVSPNVGSNVDHVSGSDIMDKDGSQVFEEVRNPESSSPEADEVSVVSDIAGYISASSPISSQLLRDDTVRETIHSGPVFLASDAEQNGRSGNILLVDMVSISSSNLSSSSTPEITSTSEARRNSRRLFWDAFSRRSSRAHNIDSHAFVFPTDDNDGLGSHDRSLLDFGSSLLHDRVGSDSGNMGGRSRNHGVNEWRRHSRSEARERLQDGLERLNPQTGICPSGLHSDGTCSCGGVLMAESSTRASISRIVMLAETLFEVLDEIHRQPVSLSLSVVSLPAPEAVVDSFPVKYHKRPDETDSADDAARCYICLSDYEGSDEIRVLPCHHEFHVSCIDKWLKEIHGVCPLCRRDVCEGSTEGSVSNSESSSV